jgi:signal transduction histidine kinase
MKAETEKITILYIDDETNNLFALKASLRLQYNIITCSSAKEAEAVLESRNDIVALLCDQRMPETTGIEFFEKIRFTNPEPVRILVTGYTDLEDVVNAINKGHIFRYIKKPWIESDLISAIEESANYYKAKNALVKQNESLKKAYKELDRFAYSVTHDLKGPIISSIELLKYLKQDDTSADDREMMLSLISASLQKLNDFVDNIFDYYKLKQGELSIDNIDFNNLIEEQKILHGAALLNKGIKFEFHVDQNMSFQSDRMNIQIILNNLINNAIKYQRIDNDKPAITVKVKVMDGNANIEVEDNGVGIEEQYQEKIFDIFYRANASETGSGIGLYNVKDAVSKLGGEIKVKSMEMVGTTFNVILPSKM